MQRTNGGHQMTTIEIKTAQGSILGISNDDGSRVFKGIPYAAAPVGILRLKRSIPHPGWKKVLDCTGFRANALQDVNVGVDPGSAYPGGLNESCLHLNIWLPKDKPDTQPLPGFIWIHGGGFTSGSGSEPLYDGARMANDGIIVVSINYRLGAFGFVWPDDGDANCGLWDQVRALEWVQENIGNFGGDRSRVTIGGESAGAGCCTCLVASPIANQLFHGAIIMSTVAHTTDDEKTAKLRATQFANSLGAGSPGARDLQAFNAKDLLAVQSGKLDRSPVQDFNMAHNTPGWQGPTLANLTTPYQPAEPDGIHYTIPKADRRHPLSHGFFPAVDGELLTQHPLDALASGVGRHITLIIGSNREENAFRPDPHNPEVSAPMTFGARTHSIEDAVRRCEWFFMGLGKLKSIGGKRVVAEKLVATYCETEAGDAGAASKDSPQHIWNRLASDMAFGASTVMVASRQAKHNPATWSYRFDGFNKRNAFHGWELGLVFGTLVNERNSEVKALSDAMKHSFTKFIKTGNPNGAPNMPEWPTWTCEDSTDSLDGRVMHFDRNQRYVDGYLDAAPGIGEVIRVIDTAFFHQLTT